MAVSDHTDEVQITMGPMRGPTCSSLLKDFANMLKAFIGSNYLTIAFAFYQSGLVLGLVGVVLIASVTAHCCNLLVKCKYHVVRKMLLSVEDRTHNTQESCCEQRYYTYDESNSSSSIEESLEEGIDKKNAFYKKLLRSMSYGDIGRYCFGKIGLALVNIAIIVTQFGFCVGYCIFIGNTIQSMIPVYNCSVPINASTPSDLDHCNVMTSFKTPHRADLTDRHSFNETALEVPHETMMQDWPGAMLSLFTTHNSSAVSFRARDATTMSPSTSPNSTISPHANTTTSIPWTDLTGWVLTRGKFNVDLRLLVLFPVPVFILTALIRSLRTMGLISLVANGAIMLGCVEVLYFLIRDFSLSNTYVLSNLKGMPIFFGLVTGAFEGIGTILPIEASMEGNRHNFTKYLLGAIFVLGIILNAFGVLGYLHFGHDVEQMINANIPSGNLLSVFVNVSLCIGVLLTFPLMLFPVIQLAENFFLGNGRKQGKQMEGEQQTLLPENESGLLSEHGAKVSSRNIPAWKRNILRITLVLAAAALAVVLRNYFAYIAAFVGALGSTMLAYILPCLFHLKLCRSELSLCVKVKDITIIILGICLGLAGMYSVISEIVHG